MADILLIRGGRVIDPSQDYDRTASLMIKEGQIIWLGEAPRRRRTSPFSTPTG
jgi:predicted amidohydrolase